MTGAIRARVRRGRLEPIDKIDLPEGKEVEVTIAEVPSKEDDERWRRSAGSWKGLVDCEKLIRDIYRDRLIRTRKRPRL